jgi:hypothetical protein
VAKNNQIGNHGLWIGPKFAIIVIAIIIIIAIHLGLNDNNKNDAYSQTPSISMNMNNMPSGNDTAKHQVHRLDNLTVSEHISLSGQLVSGDYVLLMDLTPFATSVEGHSHIAMKIPCNENGSPKVTVAAGVAPNLKSLNIGRAINNGTLNGSNIDLSNEGKSCLYHTDLPNGVTDIVLINTSNETLNFEGGYYSITVTIHGRAIAHDAT